MNKAGKHSYSLRDKFIAGSQFDVAWEMSSAWVDESKAAEILGEGR